MTKYLNLFDFSQDVDYKTELLAGLTVALALVPEAVAFAIIAGLDPLIGLYAAFVMGFSHQRARRQTGHDFGGYRGGGNRHRSLSG